ncbi:DUF2726 domain-containing protein [Synechococcus sp. PCC 6312]|uniref:DUF2726 domain-containing protein n=1 Tax=Synechococcus sp. (strain ATCC 27167 / PCC 6312) TaxID=195253 RepID=UPI00029F1825|nr:DUF2726 domain-containing protein [Synechococcus sp. PCC 6312]AFY61576.1 Protein of unknown function (DUF2726) [Synechococcus sp. PCC 6312]
MKRTKRILNFHEDATHAILSKVASQNGARVFVKTRVADVLEIKNSGLSNVEYSYALKSHFDFVVADSNHEALFAVEFDGPHHQEDDKAAANDTQKDNICRCLQFPILRANADFLTKKIRQSNILSWLVELWFIEREFIQAQEAGEVPFDEPFIYFSILAKTGDSEITMPYDLSLPLRLLMKDAHKQRLIKDSCPSVHSTEDKDKFVNAIALLRIDTSKVIVGKARCRSYQFSPVSARELSEELAIIDLGEKLKAYLNKQFSPWSIEQAQQEIKNLEEIAKQNNSFVYQSGIDW